MKRTIFPNLEFNSYGMFNNTKSDDRDSRLYADAVKVIAIVTSHDNQAREHSLSIPCCKSMREP